MTPTTPSPISDQATGEPNVTPALLESIAKNRGIREGEIWKFDSIGLSLFISDIARLYIASIDTPTGAVAEPVAYLSTDPKLWGGCRIKKQGTFTAPVYAAPTAPTTGSAPSALGEMVGWCYEHGGRTRFVNRGDTYSDSIVSKMKPVYYAAPASPAASEPMVIARLKESLREKSSTTLTVTCWRADLIALLAASIGGDRTATHPASEA